MDLRGRRDWHPNRNGQSSSFLHPNLRRTHLEKMSPIDLVSLSEPPDQVQSNSIASDLSLLDNPIWNSLGTDHSTLSVIQGAARRFPAEIGPLAGIPDQSLESYADLRGLAGQGAPSVMALFLEEPPAPPAGWTLLRGGLLDQMACTEPAHAGMRPSLRDGEVMRPLTANDAPAMVELAKLTEPGPFELRTMELGAFFGIFQGTRLVAMSGQRLSLPGFVEVSAVCTHPDARGRGFAPALMSKAMEHIFNQGKIPFLHSYASNAPAIAVYRRLGFTFRRYFHLAILQNEF
jgi:ribosomal protein S18 acetylase RimI-like enzyme